MLKAAPDRFEETEMVCLLLMDPSQVRICGYRVKPGFPEKMANLACPRAAGKIHTGQDVLVHAIYPCGGVGGT